MCDAMDQLARELAEDAAEEAAYKNSIETAQMLIGYGQMPLEKIAECTHLPLEKVQELAAGHIA